MLLFATDRLRRMGRASRNYTIGFVMHHKSVQEWRTAQVFIFIVAVCAPEWNILFERFEHGVLIWGLCYSYMVILFSF